MQLRRCDQCGNEISEHATIRYTLERQGIDMPSFGEDPSPKDFCSLACVAFWAAKQVPGPWTMEMPAGKGGSS